MPGKPDLQWVADGVHMIEDRRRGRNLLLLVKHIGAVQAVNPIASRSVLGIIQGDIHAACLDTGEVAIPNVENCVDRLVATLTKRRSVANGIDLRLGRIARDQGGKFILANE